MTRRRIVIAIFALAGAFLGAVFGALVAPKGDRYMISADVAMVPGRDLTTEQSSGFWDVLTRGQISRTAAIIYDEYRWKSAAAKAVGVSTSELTVEAGALPETSMLTVTVTANSAAVAEAALDEVLNTAAPQVAEVTAPFDAMVLWPPEGSAYLVPVPPKSQAMAAGALAGLLAGGSIGWYFKRRRPPARDGHSDDTGEEVEDTGRHRS